MIFISFCEEKGSGCWVQHFPLHLHCSGLFACGVLRRTEMKKKQNKKKQKLFQLAEDV